MIKEDAFKTWLEQGGAASIAGQNSRVSAIRTIERKLDELAMPFRNLDEAWEADRFESLSKRLGRMRKNARDGGHDYRILMPDSENPHNRLPSWRSWLGQYGRFLAGEPPGSAKDADRIRQYVLEYYIEPAREEERGQADVLVRDVNTALGLNEAWPNICQALAGRKFQEQAQIRPPERIGADKSSATVFRFDLRDYIDTETIPDTSEGRERRPMPISPVNLILYGPPGTGKTYSTAAEAVGLCGEPVPEDRRGGRVRRGPCDAAPSTDSNVGHCTGHPHRCPGHYAARLAARHDSGAADPALLQQARRRGAPGNAAAIRGTRRRPTLPARASRCDEAICNSRGLAAKAGLPIRRALARHRAQSGHAGGHRGNSPALPRL